MLRSLKAAVHKHKKAQLQYSWAIHSMLSANLNGIIIYLRYLGKKGICSNYSIKKNSLINRDVDIYAQIFCGYKHNMVV